MMHRCRAENQVESRVVIEGHEIVDSIVDVGPGSATASDLDQPLADVEPDDLLEVLREQEGESSGSAAGVQRPVAAVRQRPEYPIQVDGFLEAREPIVISGKPVEGLPARRLNNLYLADGVDEERGCLPCQCFPGRL